MSNDTPRNETSAPNAEEVNSVALSRFSERFASRNHAREVATSARRSSIGLQIKEQFADGKWHPLDTIAETINADEDHVRATLDRITKTNHTYFGCTAERKKVGTRVEYRIFKINKTISSNELIEKLTPIIEGLRAEGKKNMVTMSPQTVAVLAHRLQKLLDEWAE